MICAQGVHTCTFPGFTKRNRRAGCQHTKIFLVHGKIVKNYLKTLTNHAGSGTPLHTRVPIDNGATGAGRHAGILSVSCHRCPEFPCRMREKVPEYPPGTMRFVNGADRDNRKGRVTSPWHHGDRRQTSAVFQSWGYSKKRGTACETQTGF